MTTTGANAAVDWLVSAAPDPDACRRAWERNPLGVALLEAGRCWDVLVPHPGRATGGVRWLVPPDGSGTLTDPVALELALHTAVAAPDRGR
ncbi:hypothetical protein CG747_00285 [Streptomyces sp. CB02959]|uniref:hypothetical protein n=1 Tax=Streptomyces sp. CB02959 TaxID=2020330 RepID=UPI000C280608|nr:hypothetical protein [Streptomyces sp. CB02959]PJN42213.1 hypothetical protein CG747_00285 [Streptomyces sp. CB02959]